jgi:hypothetical protein
MGGLGVGVRLAVYVGNATLSAVEGGGFGASQLNAPNEQRTSVKIEHPKQRKQVIACSVYYCYPEKSSSNATAVEA